MKPIKIVNGVLIVLCVMSGGLQAKSSTYDYTFSVVPQQSASKTARIWGPVLKYLGKETGYRFKLKTAKNIPTFEQRLKDGDADFSYMNPYHYTVFHDLSGYNAIAKAKNKKIKGIVVVGKDSQVTSLEQLKNQTLAFPSPAAFAASMLPRSYMKMKNIDVKVKYVASHDSVYRNVAKGRFVAGGGVVRTFKNTAPDVRKKLRILWTTKGYTPHAIAAHRRLPKHVVDKVQAVLTSLHSSQTGKQMLQKMKIKGFEKADNRDWDDVRGLKMNELQLD